MIKKTKSVLFVLLLLISLKSISQNTPQRYTISGYVKEKSSGELLPGVTIYLPSLRTGTSTNAYGFYSITVPQDSYEVVFSFVGYEAVKTQVNLEKDTEFNLDLEPSLTKLEEIEVVAEQQEKVSEQAQMSLIKVPVQQLKDIPAFLGEKDVLKVLQLMPGVQSGSEGSSGLYVRGGGPDQNLLILDDATVYNANHLFGFFSVFNGDALKSVELYKGGFPARFGGRLSSVIKMDMKEGHKEEYHGKAAIGLISSSAVLEGPLKKGKSSFLLSGRRTYIDLLTRPLMPADSKGGYYFYDLNAKLNYELSQKDKIYLSGYFGRDRFSVKDMEDSDYKYDAGIDWGNATATLRWNHLFNNKLFANTAFIFSDYEFGIDVSETYQGRDFMLKYKSGIRDFSIKHDLDFLPHPKHHIRAGFQSTFHTFIPSAFVLEDESENEFTNEKEIYESLETGIYLEDNYKPTEKINIEAGLRLSHFVHNNKQYFKPEPRISAAYQLAPNLSAKASFASMNQYIHLLSNSGIGLPTDLWVSSTDKVKPQSSNQVALGLAKDFPDKNFSLTLETYYKKSKNVIGYKEGATFLVLEEGPENSEPVNWEDNVTSGQGTSYGAELLLQRKYGKFSGWIGYTLSWTKLQFDEINFGNPFFAKYDRRHDLSIVGIYKPKKNITLSASWVYGTGNNYTLAKREYYAREHHFQNFPPYIQNVSDYEEKNNFRAEAYHRLDVGIQFHKKKKRWTRTWEIGVYNLYNRKNPFFYMPSTKYEGNQERGVLEKITLFPVLPSFSYRIEF
ncbi:TonB-dependent receptor [Xanthovirga aplysinae]|uniref:TonB-dependent receptor n=1 Tax=Xanthovirga aplysinae TaxID=2529853 RepID=UPI0012BB59C1|nr:TonB-dependent receptor [Xanthovirga aplysinae]MTI31801.1 TonB-dependent receptor [Xanthovirga aplysinae]